MKAIINLLIFGAILTSCKNGDNNRQESKSNQYQSYSDNYEEDEYYEEEEYEEEEKVYDGEFCAEITYYNSNTGRESEYTLTIEVYENELERINFPNGWLDDDHYGYVVFDEDGYVSFTSDRGYDYTVQIIGEANGCFESVPRAFQCIGITEEGDQCEHLTDNPSGYCWQHEDQDY